MTAQIEIRVGEDDGTKLIRSIYGDLPNLPDPLKLGLSVRIFNYDSVSLYMQVLGAGTGWTFTTTNAGVLAAGSNMVVNIDQFGSRAKPAAETLESVTITLKAYTDAGYSALKWTYDRVVSVVLIKSDDGSWAVDQLDNFDDGTVQGWAVANENNNTGGYPQIAVDSAQALSAPYSLKMTQLCNAAHTAYQHYVHVAFNAVNLVSIGSGGFGTGSNCAAGDAADRMPTAKWMRTVTPLTPNLTAALYIRNWAMSYYSLMCTSLRGRFSKNFTTANKAQVYAIVNYRVTRSGAYAYTWIDDFEIVSK